MRLVKTFALVLLVSLQVAARGQAIPAAVRPITEQVGGGFSYARPDIFESYIKGFTVFADVTYKHRFGIEANFHDNDLLTPSHLGERTYLFGPIVTIIHQERLSVYGKGLAGWGQVVYKAPFVPSTETHRIYAFGGGIEYRVSHRLTLRPADIEEQWWPGWQPNGLSPFVVTLGAAYTFK